MRWMTLLVCVLLFLVPLATSRAQDDAPPYLFYYSNTLNSFVIERADGTDSRLFGENMMPPETNTVQGPGWSPSGQWFAWSSVTVSSYYHSASQPHALSADGTRRLTSLDAYPHARLEWAPHTDLLLVAGQDYHPSSDPVTSGRILMLHVALIDPEADGAIVSLSWPVPCEVSGEVIGYPQFDWGWSSDGQHVIIRHSELLDDSWSGVSHPVVVHVIGLDGSTVDWRFEQPVLSRVPGVEYVTTAEGTMLAVENVVTGEREVFEDAPAQISRLEWRADGGYALIFASACPEGSAAECEIDLWLLDRSEGQFSLIYPQVGSEYLAYPVESPWSPGGTYAVFLAGDGSFYGVDPAKKQAERLTPPLDDPTDLLDLTWLGWQWVDDSRIMLPGAATGDEKQDLYLADLDTGTVDIYAVPAYCCMGYFDIPHTSASGRYAAYLQKGGVILDTVAGVVQKVPPDSRSYFSSSGGEALWHPAADWLIISAGTTYRWISVTNASGSSPRELASCLINTLCAAWLPPQVDPSSLAPGHNPPPTPEPAYILHDTHWAWALSWSPDGARLLAGRAPFESRDEYRGGPGISTLWDVTRGQLESELPLVDWDQAIAWTGTQDTAGYMPVFESLDETYGFNVLTTSPDGSQRVTWGEVEDTATGDTLLDFGSDFALSAGGGGYPVTVSYSADGRWLAAPLQRSTGQPCLTIWDASTWAVLATIPGEFQAVAFSPDGRWLAASQSWTITVWDVSTLIDPSAY